MRAATFFAPKIKPTRTKTAKAQMTMVSALFQSIFRAVVSKIIPIVFPLRFLGKILLSYALKSERAFSQIPVFQLSLWLRSFKEDRLRPVMNIPATLAQELGIRLEQVEATLKLLDEGDSVPFIARYRKEITGSLDDVTLRNLSERLTYLQGLEDRRKSILESITEQGKLTPELQSSIEAAGKLSELENRYRPYKKKRKTKAS